jgi:hypothetical protein
VSRIHRRPLTLLSAAAAALVLISLSPATSQAAGLSGGPCQPGSSSQVFAPWGDPNFYTLVPGGDFESSATGWTLAGGASVVGGSEPFAVTGVLGSSSLGLPAGASALSPPACVNVSKPTVELFAQASTPGTSLTVSVVYQNNGGNTVSTPVATLTPGATWQPSGALQLPTVSAPGQTGGSGYLALQFTSTGGSAQIDDVYIDPWGGR